MAVLELEPVLRRSAEGWRRRSRVPKRRGGRPPALDLSAAMAAQAGSGGRPAHFPPPAREREGEGGGAPAVWGRRRERDRGGELAVGKERERMGRGKALVGI